MSDAQGFDRVAEISRLLETDDTRLGEVWRREQEGASIAEIAAEFDVTTAPIHAYLGLIRAIRDGEITTSPTVATRNASRIRSWLKLKPMSPALRSALEAQEATLNVVAEDVTRREQEDRKAVAETEHALNAGPAGVYVYTLPHYVRHPFDPVSGRTLLKVGHSSRDALYRANAQGRLTSLPEDPVLLRIYPAEESAAAERTFHDWLRAADHAQSEARRGGREWFVTSTRFLDHIARSLNLEIRVLNADLDPVED